jgi:phosphorylated CTD-interacting factor 1
MGGIPPLGDHGLSHELAAAGWRRCWSKRENRIYFWNKLTNESLWEMPILKSQQHPHFDPVTDPLGIQCGGGPGGGTKRRAPDETPAQPKRFVLA